MINGHARVSRLSTQSNDQTAQEQVTSKLMLAALM
jgi:hypothetical protein